MEHRDPQKEGRQHSEAHSGGERETGEEKTPDKGGSSPFLRKTESQLRPHVTVDCPLKSLSSPALGWSSQEWWGPEGGVSLEAAENSVTFAREHRFPTHHSPGGTFWHWSFRRTRWLGSSRRFELEGITSVLFVAFDPQIFIRLLLLPDATLMLGFRTQALQDAGMNTSHGNKILPGWSVWTITS